MSTKPKKLLLLKDLLLNRESVNFLSLLIKKAHPKFKSDRFLNNVLEKFPDLELKERVSWVRKNIEKHLPSNYSTTLKILLKSLKNKEKNENFIFAAYSEYAEMNYSTKDLKVSLDALGVFTEYCSAEFSIRHFINKFPKETFLQMKEWSKSENFHQRRLASEGLRPKLPWAKSIDFKYQKGATILDNLFYDYQRYVTRSVANHLNDISKIDPDFVLDTLSKWKKSKMQTEKELDYITKHSLRTLIKKGHPKTFQFLGFNANPKITIPKIIIKNKTINLNTYLEFSFSITAKSNEKLIIDYKITYPSPTNRLSEKIFKLKNIKIPKGENIQINKKHLFKTMTTKKLYSGKYKIEIQINGKILDSTYFILRV